MIRIMFPYILFISLTSLAGSVLNVYRRFAIPAFTPVLLNVAVIGAAVFLARYFDPPIVALAWGVFIGGVAQLAFQVAPLARIGMLPRFSLDWRDEGVRRVLLLMGPAVLGRVGRADLGAHQHAARRAAGRRPHLVDHLRGPADGVPERAAGRRARHRDPAVAGQAPQRRQPRRILLAARLGSAPRVPAGAAGGARAVAARGAAGVHALPVRQVQRSTTCGRRARRWSATASACWGSSWSRSWRPASTPASTCARR